MGKKEPGVADNQVSDGEAGVSVKLLAVHPAEQAGAVEGELTQPAVAETTDKYHGHGGSYVVDDATQTRRPNK